MNKKRIVITLLVLLAFIAVLGGALYKYEHRAPVTTTDTLQQRVTSLQAQDQTLTTTNDTLNAEITNLGAQKAQLCADLTKAKVSDEICLE